MDRSCDLESRNFCDHAVTTEALVIAEFSVTAQK